jgi:iron complex transport system substrate-binding protein
MMAGAGALAAASCAPVAQARAGDLAAGQPAALLIWALAPERLLGWPRSPSRSALAALSPRAATLPQLGALTGGAGPADLERLASLKPRLILDYGDVDPEYQALADRLRIRLGAEWHLIDGALDLIPQAVTQAGDMLGGGHRASTLADLASRILARWRAAPAGPAFYYARGADGMETGFAGALATEVLEGAGWTNVATGGRDIGRVSREQVAAWDPEVIVTLSSEFVRNAALDPVWRRRRNGTRRRLLWLPDVPFGWIDRPPSLNRLLGCTWLADQNDRATIERLGPLLYGAPSPASARPRWVE